MNRLTSYLIYTLFSFQEGSRIGVQRPYDGTLHFFVDSKYKGAVASDIPQVSVCFFSVESVLMCKD